MKKKILALMMALSVMLSMCAATVSAESAYTPIAEGTHNGHSYQVFDERISWQEASEYCEKNGGHLATITSEEENSYLMRLLPDSTGYMIGMHRDYTGYEKWVTGESVAYSNWAPGQPDNLGGHQPNCILCNYYDGGFGIKPHLWDDGNDNTYGFICEWDYVRSSFGSEISEWASTEIEEAYDKKLIPESLVGEDLTQPITRAEFAAVSVKTYELMANTEALPAVNNPFTDTKDVEVLKAYNTGITTGISATEFAPNVLLNREQAATMLTRVFKRATMKGWTIETDAQFELEFNKPTAFADDNKISAWAKDSVYFMVANEIINGVGGNKFAPQNTTSEEEATGYANATREQALIIATRMVENLK